MAKNLPKITLDTDVFVYSQGLGGVPHVLNPSIFIVWIQLMVVGLRMLSGGEYLAVLRPNLSVTRPQIAISEHLLTGHNQ